MITVATHSPEVGVKESNMLNRLCALAALVAVLAAGAHAVAGDPTGDPLASLKAGDVTLKSAGPLAFGPKGILFIGDPAAAMIYAVDTGDRTAPTGDEAKALPNIEGVNDKVASALGDEAKNIRIADLAVNPISGTTYLSVARGKGPNATAVILRATRTGAISELPLRGAKSAGASITGAVEGKSRQESITHMAYRKGRVIIAGLSNEEFASKLRAVPFPFDKTDKGTSVEIYHGAHGKFETRSPVRVFAIYQIKGEDHVLAAYTCTPLVKFPVSDLKPGTHVKGTTVAELGNMNRPLSMVVYQKDGKDYVLMANSARGVMKVRLEGIESIDGITKPIRGGGTAGLKYETIKGVSGVQKLDAFDKDHAVVLVGDKGGRMDLKAIALP